MILKSNGLDTVCNATPSAFVSAPLWSVVVRLALHDVDIQLGGGENDDDVLVVYVFPGADL